MISRSTQTWHGNDMDTYADDLAALIDALDPTRRHLRRPLDRRRRGHPLRRSAPHRAGRQGALVPAVPPFMVRTADNPGGVPIEVFNEIRAGSLRDRAQLYRDLATGRSSVTTCREPTCQREREVRGVLQRCPNFSLTLAALEPGSSWLDLDPSRHSK